MEKTDRELLIKEISTRLPYGVKAKVWGWDEEKGEVEVPLRIYSINTDGYVSVETNDYEVDYLNVENCLLYLRPMSSMTEEEKIEYKNVIESLMWTNELDFYNKYHFDYRGLIEKGLAIAVTEENNPYK